jgi:glutathione S-transferase
MKLLIGNKNYSSWSLRPWLVLTHFNIAFEEQMFLLNGEGWKDKMIAATPNGCVPVLVDGQLAIAETIAIIEYLADKFPKKSIWPSDMGKRALARAAAAEMHAVFGALRNAAPMNLRQSYPGRVALDEVGADISRLEQLLGGQLARSGGPFLFGEFCAADAMFAPVAARFKTYDLPASVALNSYFDAIFELESFKKWRVDALKEPWIVEADEIDFIQGK